MKLGNTIEITFTDEQWKQLNEIAHLTSNDIDKEIKIAIKRYHKTVMQYNRESKQLIEWIKKTHKGG